MEAAISLSALVVVVALCLAAIAAIGAQLGLLDAVGAAARLAARGDSAAATAALEQWAPAGSRLWIETGADLVTVGAAAPALGSLLPGVDVRAQVVAAREPAIP